MSAPVKAKFRQEFEGSETRWGCFGFLRGRKVRKEDKILCPVFRSPKIDNFSEYFNEQRGFR
jgi:hypothetical protein